MIAAARYRGQPLIALLLLLGGWVAIRAVVWDAAALPVAPSDVAVASAIEASPVPVQDAGEAFVRAPGAKQDFAQSAFVPPLPSRSPAAAPAQIPTGYRTQSMAPANLAPPPSLVARPVAPVHAANVLVPSDSRWSGDGWLLLRGGGSVVPASGFAPSSYGASQAGAVVRYRLAPASAYRPALYLRGSAALNGSREREVAFGVSARPIAGVPVALAAEARVNSQPGGTRLRPAAFAYTQLPPIALGRSLKAEFYGQAGYVGGSFASLFADGQLRVDSRIAGLGRGELRAGGGAWGGAQRGASRLDVGPTATLGVPLGETAAARVGVDWRFRVAGSAAPDSGPALTLSAGF